MTRFNSLIWGTFQSSICHKNVALIFALKSSLKEMSADRVSGIYLSKLEIYEVNFAYKTDISAARIIWSFLTSLVWQLLPVFEPLTLVYFSNIA